MRVSAGECRGRKLAEPRGREVTRPTTDRVREACASMVESALDGGIDGARVLDAFAGSGALGIEMLSRGASFASFFDIDRAASGLVRRNLDALGCGRERFRVSCADVLAAAERGRVAGAPFDLILIDAPYALGPDPAVRLLESLAGSGAIAPGALAVIERSSSQEAARPVGFLVEREKRYGLTCVDLLRFESAARS